VKPFLSKHYPILLILILGFLFRAWRFSALYGYGHEQDLQNFIIKDILVDHHPRLIGQETSITGVFIGPLYYYVLAIFFFVFSMNPLAVFIPITTISMATLVSIYWVTNDLYSKQAGIIASFVYAVSPVVFMLDRWVVPTQPTLLWIVWFYWVLVHFSRSNFKVLPVLVVLIALIWHIHIAFVPLLLLLPIAMIMNKKSFKKIQKQNTKYLLISGLIAFALLTPLVVFEMRHGFSQTQALLTASYSGGMYAEVRTGYYKLYVIAKNIDRVLLEPFVQKRIFPFGLIIAAATLFIFYLKKIIARGETLLITIWVGSQFVIHFFSKRALTEYYFNNLLMLSIIVSAVALSKLAHSKTTKIILAIIAAFSIFSSYGFLKNTRAVGEYKDKSAAVAFIAQDAAENSYPCVAINYIGPIGVEFGYRYLFWHKDVALISSGNDLPVYSIVRPAQISESEIAQRFGDIGVILPAQQIEVNPEICTTPTRQLLPLNGFVN